MKMMSASCRLSVVSCKGGEGGNKSIQSRAPAITFKCLSSLQAPPQHFPSLFPSPLQSPTLLISRLMKKGHTPCSLPTDTSSSMSGMEEVAAAHSLLRPNLRVLYLEGSSKGLGFRGKSSGKEVAPRSG